MYIYIYVMLCIILIIYIYVSACVCVYMYIYVVYNLFIYIYIYIYIYMCVCLCVCVYICYVVYNFNFIYKYIYIYMCVCACVYVYIYIYMYIYIYIYVMLCIILIIYIFVQCLSQTFLNLYGYFSCLLLAMCFTHQFQVLWCTTGSVVNSYEFYRCSSEFRTVRSRTLGVLMEAISLCFVSYQCNTQLGSTDWITIEIILAFCKSATCFDVIMPIFIFVYSYQTLLFLQ